MPKSPPFYLDGPPKDGKLGTDKCALCRKTRWNHQATSLSCPIGGRTRIGFTTFHSTQIFKERAK